MKNFVILFTLFSVTTAHINARVSRKRIEQKSQTKKTVDVAAKVQAIAPKPGIKRTISITNSITPAMLKYKHWSGTKVPDPFAIIVDGKELAAGETANVTIEDNALNVQYKYSFMMGYRKATQEVTFQVAKKQNKLAMTFSWQDDNRVLLDHAKAVAKKKV